MSSALSLESQAFALDLYQLLQSVDPARLRASREAELRAWAERLSARASELVAEAEGSSAALHQHLSEIAAQLQRQLPDLGGTASEVRAAWAPWRARMNETYALLAAALQEERLPVPTFRATNYRRSLMHALSGLLVVGLVDTALGPLGCMLAAGAALCTAWTLEITRRIWPEWNTWLLARLGWAAHPHEAKRVNSSTWFITALFLLSLTGDLRDIRLAVLVLSLADPAAGLIGRRFGRTRLRAGRSLEGSLAFVVTGTLVSLALLAVAYPAVPGSAALLLSLAVAVSGAVAEVLVPRPDDNLSIPLAGAAGGALVGALLGLG